MARPAKSVKTTIGHRTKAELEQRKKAEMAMKSANPLQEWKKKGPPRSKSWYFSKVKKLFAEVDEDSDMYSAVINRYCELMTECGRLERETSKTLERMEELEKRKDEMEFADWLNAHIELTKAADRMYKTLDRKRGMLLAIEKENMMTVMAKLRAVPKKPQEDSAEEDAMEALLAGRPKINVFQ